MSPVETARDKLKEAVARARARGIEIGFGHYGVQCEGDGVWRYVRFISCCPMGCLLLDTPGKSDAVSDAAEILSVSKFAALQFVRGFEGAPFSFSRKEILAGRVPYDEEFYDLGVEFRVEVALDQVQKV